MVEECRKFDKWVPQFKIMASKSQEVNVLENWEEIDDTDEVLEKEFKKLITTPGSNSVDNNGRSNGSVSNNNPMKIILTGEDALRSQYVPPEPTVKILKRPSKDAHSVSDLKTYQPKKTLQQREQEYAEARLRILGEAAPDTDKTDEKLISIQNKQKIDAPNNVIRMPKGPDGTNGFKVRR